MGDGRGAGSWEVGGGGERRRGVGIVVEETFGVEFGEMVGDVGTHSCFLVGVEGFLTCEGGGVDNSWREGKRREEGEEGATRERTNANAKERERERGQ